ncbi:MAG: hypothetical protein HYX24_03910 [Candidatus Aenigmarchaeota archaeon]|nr:hypothetical protein [Candidatus Aenigmarchaeota archaeon]
MPIIGMNVRGIEASKKGEEASQKIDISSTPRITDIKEVDFDLIGKKVLSVAYEFTTTYEPQIGRIKISGELFYMARDGKDIAKQWKKDKKLPEPVSLEILNHLFRRCLLKTAQLSEDLQLPPPIQMPRVMPKKPETSYVG